jgi:DNA-directed RNA polymerase subunit RPC12/RpoP
MGKRYVCENCGATYTQMPIDAPNYCSVECAVRALLTSSTAVSGQTGANTKGNGRAQ